MVPNMNNFSPQKAEIESLKIELGYAHTKIVDIQVKNRDLEETIKIYSEKLSLLENCRTENLQERYFPSPPAVSSSPSSDCPCQTKALINRTATNLKNFELKINQELQKITCRLDRICSGPLPTTVPTPPPTHSTMSSSTTNTVSPDMTNLHARPVVSSNITSQFVFSQEGHETHVAPDHGGLEMELVEEESNHESDFSFSESFEQPDHTPRVPLN